MSTRFQARALLFLSVVIFITAFEFGACPEAYAYRRAIEGKDNVKKKLYKRRKKFELSAPNVGIILNQSYINSMLLNGGFVYHMSSEWAFGLDVSMSFNSDKPERTCIESFYNDPNEQLSAPCPGPDGDTSEMDSLGDRGAGPDFRQANYGPAYVPIREITNIIIANAVWTPVYGKQLILLSATSYFDFYFEFGGGVTMSQFYPQQKTLFNGYPSRGEFNKDGTFPDSGQIGAEPEETDSYGIDGRPVPESQTHLTVNLGVGQKFHFGKRFHLKMYLRNFTLLATEDTFQNLFALYTGVGLRF